MAALDRENIIETLESYEGDLKDFGVVRIGLFGSFLSGEFDESSDLDFLVKFEENSFDNYMKLKLFLEDLFDRDVDLVIESDVRPELEYVVEEAEYVSTA
jgi:predicted nucleotidyltransferase